MEAAHHQEETERVEESSSTIRSLDVGHNVEATRRQNDRERKPESTIGRQSSGTESVTDGHLPVRKNQRAEHVDRVCGTLNLPHAGQKLNKPAISESERNDDVGCGQISGSNIDQGEDEGRQGESGKTERGRVGELAAFDALVQTRLELTTEGRKSTINVRVEVSEGAMSEASCLCSSVFLFDAHVLGSLVEVVRVCAVDGARVLL